MEYEWFKPRHYKHFDRPFKKELLDEIVDPTYVSTHSFLPLMYYSAETKRYNVSKHKTIGKPRPIMYASHKDSAIFSWHSNIINNIINSEYDKNSLSESVIAYRALGKGNYHFSAEVYNYAASISPCTILAFDVTGFFDNLDHGLLKARLKKILGVAELPRHWYNVFRAITRFRYVELSTLKAHPDFAGRFKDKHHPIIATVAELKDKAIPFLENGMQLTPKRSPNSSGIAQGTPISAALSNLYMIDFDIKMKLYCDSIGALYRRYSDDILIVCKNQFSKNTEDVVRDALRAERLTISAHKTEITAFDVTVTNPSLGPKSAQYLGFTFYPGGPGLRSSSLSRQWRKMRRAVNRARFRALNGNGILHTRKLRKRFTPIFDPEHQSLIRSFPSYAIRSADAFGNGAKILHQANRLQRAFEREIASVKKELEP